MGVGRLMSSDEHPASLNDFFNAASLFSNKRAVADSATAALASAQKSADAADTACAEAQADLVSEYTAFIQGTNTSG